jgi:hypothetical protein
MVNYMQFVKESPDKPCSAETCKILARELLLWLTTLAILCYIIFHLCGASFSAFSNNGILPGKEAFCI